MNRGVSAARSSGLFDNLPMPRSTDRRDPRHDPDYDDHGLGYGKQFDEMRRPGEKVESGYRNYREFDGNGNNITVGKQEQSLSDYED